MSLHVLAAIYSSLGRFEGAIPVLEWAIQVPDPPRGADHALAAFSDHMQLGDMFSMLGKVDCSITCYEEGLKIQIEALGDTDPRVGETCSCRFEFSCFWFAKCRSDRHREMCLLCPIVLCERREREVFGVLENEENENIETWVFFFFLMERAGLNLSMLFLG